MVYAMSNNGFIHVLSFRAVRVAWLLVLCLNLPTMGFAGEKFAPNGRVLATSSGTNASPHKVSESSAEACPTARLPRYYFGFYTMVNDKGDLSLLTDEYRIGVYLDDLKTLIDKSRVLRSEPDNCSVQCPCEELILSERVIEKNGNGIKTVGIDTLIEQKPPDSSSQPWHQKTYESPSSIKETLDGTRPCLAISASRDLKDHDLSHTKAH
jgi:hypothetical protein